MTTRFFYVYGGFCATHPWEIMAVLTVTTCLLTVESQHSSENLDHKIEHNADFAFTILIQCLVVICSCFQFCKLLRTGKNYVLGTASLLTVLLSFLLTSTMINYVHADLANLKTTLLCFLLISHLSKAGKLEKFDLHHDNVKENIGTGMARLGPTMTEDTFLEALVIGMGTLSGVDHLNVASYSLLLSVLVNYAVFMTFYPACLALIIDFHKTGYTGGKFSVSEEEEKINPVAQRVKLIMTIGLSLVHLSKLYSRWFYQQDKGIHIENLNKTESDTVLRQNILKWVPSSTYHIVILMIFLALVVKFVFFEDEEDNRQQHFEETKDITIVYEEKESQTEHENKPPALEATPQRLRDLDECLEIYNLNLDASKLTDEEVTLLVKHKHIAIYQIEKAVADPKRGVKIRRNLIGSLTNLPFENYDYTQVLGACCENIIGYVPLPVGIVGPLHLDGQLIRVPLATTEGCLVASTNRGSRALLKCGITSKVVDDGMTRGPVVRFPSVTEASTAKSWMEEPENFELMKNSFDASSRFARLTRVGVRIVGRLLYLRFVATTGDAMGMNMLCKGTELSLKMVKSHFPKMEILSLSGNTCTDKKSAAINWIEGRGKSVVCEAIVPGDVVSSVLKTTVGALVEVNTAKNLIGSAVAGSIGGFNAHAANLVTAIFIATGQDPAQNVGSSNCMTLMEPWGERGEDLYMTCTMPSIEVGTVGGGTGLLAQSACLEILGVKGPHKLNPGENANKLARIVCGTVLAGELSLISALTSGHLVKSHLKHNRSDTKFS